MQPGAYNLGQLTIYTADGQMPTAVGTYSVTLSESGQRRIKALDGNGGQNYDWTFDSTGTYTINQSNGKAELTGANEKTFDGQPVTTIEVNKEGKITVTVTVPVTRTPEEPGQIPVVRTIDLGSYTLQDGDYSWTDGSAPTADGTYTVMTGLPTNVGTYYLKLKDSGINKIKNANTNYSFSSDAIGGMYTYTITAATGSATLNGSASKTYDGHPVTTAEVNSTDGDIQITFNFPGSAGHTYQLQAGEYSWYDEKGHPLTTAPTNAGTYTIKINSAKLQDIIDRNGGNGNIVVDNDANIGSATFTIKKKDLNVTLGDKTGTNAGKTYDGQAGVIDPHNGSLTPSGLISGETLNMVNIPASDYQWVDKNGNPLATAPTDAGTYYIALNAAGLQKLQDNNPNYNIIESGRFKYVISTAEVNVTIGGSQESTKTDIDNSKFNTSGATGITIPTGLTYQFTNGTPTESGTYDVTLTSDGLQKLKAANKNYSFKITSNAKFTLDATLTITFEDTTEGNVTVPNTTVTKTGVNGKSVDLSLTIPENYELATNQTLPTYYTFGKALNQALNIKLVHKTQDVDPTKPETNPKPTDSDWFKQIGLAKDVTQTIEYEGLTPAQLAQIPDSEKSQTVHFTRTAKYDLVTGKLVPSSEGTWTAHDGKDTWAGFKTPEFAGYTADLVCQN